MIMKKIGIMFAALALSLGLCTAASANEQYDESPAILSEEGEASLMASTVTSGLITYEVSGSNATIISIADNDWLKITIGATIPNKTTKIVAIADGVGNNLTAMTTLDMSGAKNLKTIGSNCFSYCTALETVKLPTTAVVTSIGDNCFYYCPKLTTVENTSKLTKLTEAGASLFGLSPFMTAKTEENVILGKVLLKYNGTDTDVTVPEGVTAIADAYFGKPIKSVDLGDVTVIGSNAFYGCRELESIDIPDSVTVIGDMAFSGCTALKTVTYGEDLEILGFCAFANCSALESFRYVGDGSPSLTSIGECAFWNCGKMYVLDAGALKNVNVGSFWNCFDSNPADAGDYYYYKIPETVKTIAEGGYGNLSFTYVAVPASVEAIAATAFGAVEGAVYVTSKGTLADEYFTNSGYDHIYYGDVTADGTTNAEDIWVVAYYIAENIMKRVSEAELVAEKDVHNYDYGRGVIADINEDGAVTTRDLYEIFQSIKSDYEKENA